MKKKVAQSPREALNRGCRKIAGRAVGPGRVRAKNFRRWRKEERFSHGAAVGRTRQHFFWIFRRVAGVDRAGILEHGTPRGCGAEFSGRVSLLKGEAAGSAVGASGKCGLLRQGRLPVLVAGTHRLAVVGKACGELRAGAREACHRRCAAGALPAVLRVADSRQRFGGIGGRRRGGPAQATHGGRARSLRCGRASLASSAHSARRMFASASQRLLTAMPSSRSSSTSFCASAGTASRHTGESPSSMVL